MRLQAVDDLRLDAVRQGYEREDRRPHRRRPGDASEALSELPPPWRASGRLDPPASAVVASASVYSCASVHEKMFPPNIRNNYPCII